MAKMKSKMKSNANPVKGPKGMGKDAKKFAGAKGPKATGKMKEAGGVKLGGKGKASRC